MNDPPVAIGQPWFEIRGGTAGKGSDCHRHLQGYTVSGAHAYPYNVKAAGPSNHVRSKAANELKAKLLPLVDR